jgi:uncharacterized RDD family membrane protein YckC
MDYQQYLEIYVAYDPILARRCLAAVIDYLIYFILTTIYGYFFGDVKEWGMIDGQFRINIAGTFWSSVLIWILYFPLLESILGYTLGKGLLDLKVVRERKDDFPLKVTFLRHFVDFIDFSLFGFVAIALVKFTKQHKRLGDFLAHSRVVLDR